MSLSKRFFSGLAVVGAGVAAFGLTGASTSSSALVLGDNIGSTFTFMDEGEFGTLYRDSLVLDKGGRNSGQNGGVNTKQGPALYIEDTQNNPAATGALEVFNRKGTAGYFSTANGTANSRTLRVINGNYGRVAPGNRDQEIAIDAVGGIQIRSPKAGVAYTLTIASSGDLVVRKNNSRNDEIVLRD